MKKHIQATQRKRNRSITQEMHQVFAEWMEKLPFIKKGTHKPPERERAASVATERETGT